MTLVVEDFQQEIATAVKNYDKFVVCVEKTPDEFLNHKGGDDGKGTTKTG